MKASSLVLAVTLALNVALLGVVVMGLRSAPPRPQQAKASAALRPADPVPANWSLVHAADLAELRRRLEREGFPNPSIRAIITAEVRESFAPRRRALELAKSAVPFWKNTAYDPALQAETRAHAREEQQAVRALLGPDPDSFIAAGLRRDFPNLSADKVDQLVAIRERYAEQRLAVSDAERGIYTPDSRERVNQLETAMRAEMAQVLTPAELEEYDLRTSRVASSLRYSLGNFALNEFEFRAVYHLKAEFEEQFPATSNRSPGELQRWLDARKQLDTNIAAALGPQRYDEYKRATDYDYRQSTLLVSRLGLPAETADALYAAKREFEQRRDAIHALRDAGVDIVASLGGLHAEATARIHSILGGNAGVIDAYRQYGGMWWQYLAPPSPSGQKR